MKDQIQFNLIAKAIRYLKDNQKAQPPLEEVAGHVYLSKYHFQRLFRKWAGISPKEFLQHITVEQAKKALEGGRSTLEAAYEAGLSGNGRLHDLFVKIEACTPGEFKSRGQGVVIRYGTIETPFGPALVAETEKGICRLSFLDGPELPEEMLKREYPNADLREGLGENGKLAAGYFRDWQMPQEKIGLDLRGTPFQIQVWRALLKIPSARFLSYQDVASLIGRPGAARAVGTAIGQNPAAYLIPCHRVINGNGDMGNYRWNKERKWAINGYERLHLNNKPHSTPSCR